MRRARLVVAYNGESFHGFAINPGVATIAGALGGALQQIFQVPVPVVSAGRTDTGVHAKGQVVSCDLHDHVDLVVLQKQLNALCGPEIVVREATWAKDDFHARFSAIWRHYQYTVYNAEYPDPFLVATAWHVIAPINLRAMQLACDPIIGTRDFSAFCRRPKPDLEPDLEDSVLENSDLEDPELSVSGAREISLKRCVMQATWRNQGDGIFTFDIRANAFCHQMVRSLVGTFIEIGTHKRPSSDMMTLIRSGDRAEASQLAPPQGLCLIEVGYPNIEPVVSQKTA